MVNNGNSFENRVFINCPFDSGYHELFKATIYTVLACGFYPVSALQQNDGLLRLEKICKLIKSCKHSIHDISMVELDEESGFPRFNMPFELGIDYGCRVYGNDCLKDKRFLIFESSKHKLEVYLSDLAGNDPYCHIKKPANIVKDIRNWLNVANFDHDEFTIPGDKKIVETLENFCEELPYLCDQIHVDVNSIDYADLIHLMKSWIKKSPGLIKKIPSE